MSTATLVREGRVAMRARALIGSTVVVIGAVACGVVDDGRVEPVSPPFGLSATLAPTTTGSTTTTAAVDTTTVDTATTAPAVQTEQVRLYFVASGQLTYVVAQLPSPVALAQIISALQAGPPTGELGTGLRTALPLDIEIGIGTDGSGVAQVVLPDGFFDLMTVTDQRLVVAQIVLTLTDSRGIGQVTFDQAVPKPSGELTPPGEPLAYRDFQSLLSTAATTDPVTSDTGG